MKRSGLRPGELSVARGSTFASRGKGLKRRRKPLRGPGEREMSEAWAHGVRGKRCAVCGGEHPKGHHIVTQQRLRGIAKSLGVPAARLLWDERNRLPLCERCHLGHHSRSRPVSWTTLQKHAPKVFQFAREVGELPRLERMYPRP